MGDGELPKDKDIVKEAAQYMSKKEGTNNERTDNN